jgi:hypothetical protein
MPIHFKTLESILNNWKMYSLTISNDQIKQLELKERMIAKLMTLFESINHGEISVSEEANLDRTYGKIQYENVIRIHPKSKL